MWDARSLFSLRQVNQRNQNIASNVWLLPFSLKEVIISMIQAVLRGVLQISNSEGDVFTFDEEYYAIVITKLIE